MISDLIIINKISENYFDLAITGVFSLRDFSILPINYVSFLKNASSQFKEFVVHYHEATSIEEAINNFDKREKEGITAQRKRTIEGLMKHRNMSEEEAKSAAFKVNYRRWNKLFVETLCGRLKYFKNLHEIFKEKKQRTIFNELILADNNGEYEDLEERIE